MSTIADSGINLDLSAEQRAIQDTVRQFVDERVLRVAIENDIDHRLDMRVIEGMAELGLLGIVDPGEYGGAGLDFVSEALDLRGDRARRGGVPHADLGARRAQLAVAAAVRHGGAEAALARAAGEGREARAASA